MKPRTSRVCAGTLMAVLCCSLASLEAQTARDVQLSRDKRAVAAARADARANAVASAVAKAAEPRENAAPPEPVADETEARVRFEQAVRAQLEAEKASPEKAEELLRYAAAGYSRALELRPGAVAALYNLGKVQLALGDVQNAAKSLELAASSPGSRRAFYLQQWADFLQEQGQRERAARAYEDLALLEPRLDKPHEILRKYYLDLRDKDPNRLLGYLWRLADGRQASRSADLALDALEAGWPERLQPEILTAFAVSLAQMHTPPPDMLESPQVRRLRRFANAPAIGRGIEELLWLYRSPGDYPEPFGWWQRDHDEWTEIRGVSRSNAFRSAMRAIGDQYLERRDTKVASACYSAAVNLIDSPDPLALRNLANVYVERGDLEALNRLANEYADPAGRLFAAKNQAYQMGQLDRILEYHRALGLIYGSLAAAGKTGWGSSSQPATALFQLEHAFTIAKRLDAETSRPDAPLATAIDPDLTLLYARGLETSGDVKRSTAVRLEAAQRFKAAGNTPASQKVLRGVSMEQLSPNQRRSLERIQSSEIRSAPAPSPKEVQLERTSAWRASVSGVIQPYANAAVLNRHMPAKPVRIDLPATVEWFDTGVDLSAKQPIELTASGQWSNAGAPARGPGGFAGYLYPGTIVASSPLAALVGRVGQTTFTVGERYSGPSPATGRLYLSINDVSGKFGDNQGSLTVTVQLRQ